MTMPEKNLENLIATLKMEAIEAAEKEAAEIVSKARAEAREIVEEADVKSDELLQNAEREAQAILDKGESALQQASRDVRVSMRNDLLLMLKGILEREVETAFKPDLVEKAILVIVENAGTGISLKLSEKLETQLTYQILERLKASKNLDSISRDVSLTDGFSIAKTGEGWSYHISPGEVTELLYAHLSPNWVEILKKASET
jgi:F0F1-type ATP synthase membrane subunit b/b'